MNIMADEYLDIVDESNTLTGKKELRSVVHATGLWHRTVHVYLFRNTKSGIDFLIHLRSKFKDGAPNCWDTRFGGHIKSGEDVERGCVNEIKEELGLDIIFSDLIEGEWRRSDSYPNCEFSKSYYLKYDNPVEELSFNDGEVQEVKWLSESGIIDSMEKERNWAASREGFEIISQFLRTQLSKL